MTGRLIRLAGWLVTGLLVSTGCQQPAPKPTGAEPSAFQSLVVSPSVAQTEQAVASLRRLDDHPLYQMTYAGPAPRLAPPGAPSAAAAMPAGRRAYACTVFLAGGDPARPVVGRNFDWDHNPALLLVARPTDAYHSISLVDLSYLDLDPDKLADLSDDKRRQSLIRATALPFDGMNEHGLAIGMAQVDGVTEQRPGRPTVGSLAVIRLALDTTRTVDEAVRLFESYTVDFTGGPSLHYLIADATGESAVVEFVAGRMRVLRDDRPWQLMTNFPLADADEATRQGDWRYRTGSARLDAAGGRLDPATTMDLLRDLRQGHTQWSVAYDLRAGTAAVATGQQYDRVHHTSLRA
ncbi:MAG TPA: C45 family peptidase [Micromonospora sp.]